MNNKASVLHRLIAGMIDFSILFIIILLPVFYLLSAEIPMQLLNRLVFVIFFLIVYSLLYPFIISLLVSRLGGTLGKMFTGTRIVDNEDRKLSFKRAFFRNHIG